MASSRSLVLVATLFLSGLPVSCGSDPYATTVDPAEVCGNARSVNQDNQCGLTGLVYGDSAGCESGVKEDLEEETDPGQLAAKAGIFECYAGANSCSDLTGCDAMTLPPK